MKRLNWILFFFLIISTLVVGQGEWQWISPYLSRNLLRSSCVIDQSIYFWGENQTILSSHDAGNNFTYGSRYADIENSVPSSQSWQRIAFCDSLTGIVLDKGVHRTTDGGKSWSKVFDYSYNFNVATFVNSKVGWIFGITGSMKTTDGGESWKVIWDPITETNRNYSRIFALDENRLWVLRYYYNHNQGDLLYSDNGGKSLNRVNVPIIEANSRMKISFNDINITNSGLGIVIGTISYRSGNKTNSFILRTTDFGNTWTENEFENITLNHIVKIKNENWLIYGNKADDNSSKKVIQLTSIDSAKTWVLKSNIFQTNYNYHYLSTVSYLPKQQVILAATNAGIYKSTDLGVSYHKLTSETDIPINDFAIDKTSNSAKQLAIAKSEKGSYLISKDGGRNWQQTLLPSEIGANVKGICIADSTIFIKVNNSKIYSSNDNGLSWNSIFNGNAYGIHNLTAFNKNIIAFVGYNFSKSIFYTNDGGNSWNKSPLPKNVRFNSLQIIAPSTFIGCGLYQDSSSARGMIYRTEDSGMNWRIIDFPKEMLHITMVSKRKGFAHSNYELYETDDSGISWNLVLSSDDYYNYYSNFAFADSLNGVMRVSYYFYRTIDGGKNWKRDDLNSPFWEGVKKMEYNNYGDLLILSKNNSFLIKKSDFTYSRKPKLIENNSELESLMLKQNYPNPFNPKTLIKYRLPYQTFVELSIYNILGEKVVTLVSKVQQSGTYNIEFDGSNFSSGIYVYVLQTGNQIVTKKMLLLR